MVFVVKQSPLTKCQPTRCPVKQRGSEETFDMKPLTQSLMFVACIVLAGCGDQNTGSNVRSPGGDKTATGSRPRQAF